MQIAKNKVVTIDYTLKNNDGDVLDSSIGAESLTYLQGANNLISGLETALEGKSIGEEISVCVDPKDGYGLRDEQRVQAVPKEMFGDENVQVGAQYRTEGPAGEPLIVTVVAVDDSTVSVDGNHPLAGIELNFDVKILEIRDASETEIEHGHVHGPDGHPHHE